MRTRLRAAFWATVTPAAIFAEKVIDNWSARYQTIVEADIAACPRCENNLGRWCDYHRPIVERILRK